MSADLEPLRHDWQAEPSTPRGLPVCYTCPHCTEETTAPEDEGGLCEVLVYRRLATLTAAHEAIAGDVPPRGEDGHCTAARLVALSEAALDPTT